MKYANTFMIFDNVSELKHYWNRKIFPLPSITKNEITRIVDPVLFFQLFFVGQDKKDTSNIAHQGLYNKRDYENMLFSFMGIGAASLSQDEIETLKSALSSLTDERKLLLQQHKILKSSKAPIAYLSSTSDRLAFGEKVTNLEKLQSKIAELRKRRNLISTRKSKWEITIKELRSLNRTITCGELRCMDCNSTNISFCTGNDTKSSYTFDVSTTEMRNEIISSISEKIDSYSEEIDRLTNFICAEQSKLHELMEDENVQLYLDDQNAVPCKEGDFNLAPNLDGMKDYISSGNMTDYQDHYYPSEMAVDAQIQTFLIEQDVEAFLEKFDKDWLRYNRDIIRKVEEYGSGQ